MTLGQGGEWEGGAPGFLIPGTAPEDLISLESAEDVARYGADPVSQVWFEAQERERLQRRPVWPWAVGAAAAGYLFWAWRQTA